MYRVSSTAVIASSVAKLENFRIGAVHDADSHNRVLVDGRLTSSCRGGNYLGFCTGTLTCRSG